MEEQLVLGRVVHYFNPGSGACQAALVVGTFEGDGQIANLSVWTHGGSTDPRTSVTQEANPSTEQSSASFHFARQCPWGR